MKKEKEEKSQVRISAVREGRLTEYTLSICVYQGKEENNRDMKKKKRLQLGKQYIVGRASISQTNPKTPAQQTRERKTFKLL